MERLINYILSDEFNEKVETVVAWVLPFLVATMIGRVLKFIIEFTLYPQNFH